MRRGVLTSSTAARALALAAAAAAALPSANAQIYPAGTLFPFNFSNTIGDHAVLQRDAPNALTGFGTPFAPFTITLVSNFTDASAAWSSAKYRGEVPAQVNLTLSGWVSSLSVWRVTLPPQPVGGPFTIFGHSPNTNESFVIRDILFGETVLLGGQSNMAFGMGSISNSTAEIEASAARPGIRILSSQYSAQNASQLQVVNEYSINWTVATPQSPLAGFSALGYLSAARVSDHFNQTIPFGLIDTSVGGTAIQLWFPPMHFSDCASVTNQGDVFGPPWTPSCWYNGMVSPFVFAGLSFSAVMWDQGENNVGEDAFYACAFPLLVNSWRQIFNNPNVPFFFVQLPAYVRANDTMLASFRDAQVSGPIAELSNTYFISTVDLGDAYEGSIHNRDKSLVGARMGNLLLAKLYNVSGVAWKHPSYGSASASTAGNTITVRVDLADADAAYGQLQYVAPTFSSNATWCPSARGVENESCDWMMVQTNDGQWHNATVAVTSDGMGVELTVQTSTAGLSAVATRNGYADWPVTNIYNAAGLPLLPWAPTNVTSSVVVGA